MTSDKMVRIGGGSAFFIDSAMAVPQLLGAGVDYIILDYLAEGAMGLMGRMRLTDPDGGFPSDFIDVHVGPQLPKIAETGTKIVANAGAVNPASLATLLRSKIAALGLDLKVACIAGDCLMHRLADFADTRDMFTGSAFPTMGVTSANAYLGAFPIAHALGRGADIVVTGRVVDSALALGPLIHEFAWGADDLVQLAGGTVAGHLIECGAQVTGGTFTDWRDVEGWANIGSPIAECYADGRCVITKPEGTGGLVSFGTVAEQLLYEVSDPATYLVPDVACDFTQVTLEEIGRDRVLVSGAIGHPAPQTLKACVTWDDGWRGTAYQPVIGPKAAEKARKQAAALFERGSAMLRARGLTDWRRTECVLIGAQNLNAEEVVAKLVVEHDEALAAAMFVREQFSAISAMAPGTSVSFGAQVQPCMGLMSFLVPRDEVLLTVDGEALLPAPVSRKRQAAGPTEGATPTTQNLQHTVIASEAKQSRSNGRDSGLPRRCAPRNDVSYFAQPTLTIGDLAYTRSGEKGETINIAVIARQPCHLPSLRAALTEAAITDRFADLAPSRVIIHDVPGIHALNIVLEGALPGGINASQRLDPAAKSAGQRLLGMGLGGDK